LEFELLDHFGEPGDVGLDFIGGALIGLLRHQLQQLCGVAQAAGEAVEIADDLLQLGALATERFSALRIVPDAGLLEFARYFLETFVFVVVIKDTSSRNRCAPRDL